MPLEQLLRSTVLIGPELILVFTGIIVLVLDAAIRNKAFKAELFWLALVGIGASFYLNLPRFGAAQSAFANALSLDAFAAFFNVLFLFGAFFTVGLSRNFIAHMRLRTGEYYSLILFATSGMMFLSSSRELMTLFLGFEIMSVSVYVLSGFNRRSPRSVEGGLKYLVLGAFASAIMLYGISLVYGAAGSVFLADIAAGFDTANPLYVCGAALILAGFLFKIGAFPLHQWVPDVYEGAPLTVTGFMSVGVKAAGFAILIRVLFEGFSQIEASWTQVLWIASLASMVLGNLMAVTQRSIKRMLAYSSIAHAGYALVGIVAAYTVKDLGIGSVLYYMLAYTIMNLGAFGILAYISRDGRECESFDDIRGLWGQRPWTAVAMGVFMFSLAGIPPTVGFFGKYNVFLSGISAGYYWLVAIGILMSVVSAYYYLRVLVHAFMSDAEEGSVEFSTALMPAPAISLGVLAVCTVVAGLLPVYTLDVANEAARSVLASF